LRQFRLRRAENYDTWRKYLRLLGWWRPQVVRQVPAGEIADLCARLRLPPP